MTFFSRTCAGAGSLSMARDMLSGLHPTTMTVDHEALLVAQVLEVFCVDVGYARRYRTAENVFLCLF